jgi:HlyD family type I secretion membrane fusion protein
MLKLFKQIFVPTPELELAGHVGQIVWMGMILIVLFFGVGGFWIVFVPMSSAVTAQGEVKVDGDVRVIQHASGGIIKRILVKDGDEVVRGQALLEFEDARVSAANSSLSLQYAAQTARAARLRAEQAETKQITFPPALVKQGASDPQVADLMQRERMLFDDHRRSYADQKNQLDLEREQLKQEIADYQQQLTSTRTEFALVKEQIASYKDLYEKQYIPKTQYQDMLRAEQEFVSRLASIDGQIVQTRQRLADLDMRRVGLRDGLEQGIVSDLQDTAVRTSDIRQQFDPARDASDRLVLRSPVDGMVFNQRVNTLGEVIGGGMVLMEVVPRNPKFVIETQVQVQDIRQVFIGQPVELRFTSFNKRSTPNIVGKVAYISPDRTEGGNASQPPSYMVRVTVDTSQMNKWGLQLKPGMAAQVSMRGENRTILSYLIAPVVASLSTALREP